MESIDPILSPHRQWLEDRIFLLEDGLYQAQNMIEFLHGCLTDPVFKYAYPEMTDDLLVELHELAPRPPWCLHGLWQADCEDCQAFKERYHRKAKLTYNGEASNGVVRTDHLSPQRTAQSAPEPEQDEVPESPLDQEGKLRSFRLRPKTRPYHAD